MIKKMIDVAVDSNKTIKLHDYWDKTIDQTMQSCGPNLNYLDIFLPPSTQNKELKIYLFL